MSALIYKTFFSVLGVVLLAVLISTLLLENRYVESVKHDALNSTSGIAHVVDEALKETADEPQSILGFWQEFLELQMSLVAPETATLDDEQRKQLKAGQPLGIVADGWARKDMSLFYPLSSTEKYLVITYNNSLDNNTRTLIVTSLSLIVLLAAISLYFTRKPIGNQVKTLTLIIDDYNPGNLDISTDVKIPRQMYRLASGFLQMGNRMRRFIFDRETLIAGQPCELKQPISHLHLNLDLRRDLLDVDRLRDHIQNMDQSVEELDDVVSDLLELAKISDQDFQLNEEIVDLSGLINVFIAEIRDSHPEIEIEFVETELQLFADPHLLQRAISDLLSNAIRFAQSKVNISAADEDEHVSVKIEDDGPGIPVEERANVFFPFYKLDDESAHSNDGQGLGLSFVHSIMSRHDGKLLIEDSDLGGASVQMMFRK